MSSPSSSSSSRRPRIAFACTAVVACTIALLSGVDAQISLVNPAPRASTPEEQTPYFDAIDMANAGCGAGAMSVVSKVTAGNTLTNKAGEELIVEWSLAQNVPSTGTNRVRISLQYSAADDDSFESYVLSDISTAPKTAGTHQTSVVLPKRNCVQCTTPGCKSCTLQILLASSAGGGTQGNFYVSCADIVITGGDASLVKPLPPDECQTSSQCVNNPSLSVCDTTSTPKRCVRSGPLSCLQGFETSLRFDNFRAKPAPCADKTATQCMVQQYSSMQGLKHLTEPAVNIHYSCTTECVQGEELGALIPNDRTGASADITTSCCNGNDCNTPQLAASTLALSKEKCVGGCGFHGSCQNARCICDTGYAGTNCQQKLSACANGKRQGCLGIGNVERLCNAADSVSGCKWCKLDGFASEICIYAPNEPCVDNYGGNIYSVGGGGCSPNTASRGAPTAALVMTVTTLASLCVAMLV